MFILHIALQGCLKARDVQYGLTPDTGGHIKYVLELVEAQAADPAIERIVIATRAFDSVYGEDYRAGYDEIDDKVAILRLPTASPAYLAKEELWAETASFAAALRRWIDDQPSKPTYLHAHYADAATVSATIGKGIGVPFVFTAHSLGRVKQDAIGAQALSPQTRDMLSRRIAIEEAAFAEADLVIASSRNEAEVQYAGFDTYDPGKIRIIEPGSKLDAYRDAAPSDAVTEMIAPFLRAPDKPVILAIARPVAKKNLPMLVEAFGRDPWLRDKANLVILAGTREDIADLDAETANEMRHILEAIDRHDLYGQVALPKTHQPVDIPSVYAFARERRGIFVNPALNEPFGLTLLEAAAAGLPVVATDSGGPNDIVELCRNGRLVNPQDQGAIAQACREILEDSGLWDKYARNGAQAVAAYDWTRHAERCTALMARMTSQGRRREADGPRQLLVCDIDNTLTGCRTCIESFSRWHETETNLDFAVASGRSFHSALSILEQQNAPFPKIIISSVGTEIYRLQPDGVTYRRDDDWTRQIARDWHRARIVDALHDMPGMMPQAPLEQRDLKLSFLTNGDRALPERIHRRLQDRHLAASVIHSHGRYLDILPVSASKGAAIAYLREGLRLSEDDVFVAGDSGNDIEMLRAVPQAIIVANYSDDLASRPDLAHTYVSHQSHAMGIIEGVEHFRERVSRERPH
ncbi:HAD-IIB family hydrolase [Fulvimarina sp. 2208YS6-2-32]|uniref:sucrose-phosphate synthase n=1 Tax=Fulvimarina uroteuthidis TaxID=3098149 RepID=A0ABU5HYF2_9HYPH|nr:HAD-IIB family hydrolase [Fulvimarina sp. 2208YS6-2-32]MDY8108154.1 HAD-IIB family hydrolase [Fulvimarina sp. 2208YS6-2-32]